MSDSNKTVEQQLFELAETLFVNENKQFVAAQLASRFKTAAEHHRYDQTINQVAFVLEKVASQNPELEITEADLHDLASKFYVPNTEFYSEFEDLFTKQETIQEQKQASRIAYDTETKHLAWDSSYQKQEGDLLANDDSIIDSSLSYSPEDLALARQAAFLIDDQLKNTGKVQRTSSVLKHVKEGSFIFQTKLKTATREVEVFVPVEINESIPMFPEVMATTEKVYEISRPGMEQFLLDLDQEESYNKTANQALFRSAEDFEIALRNDSMENYAEEVDEESELVHTQKQASLLDNEIEETLIRAIKAKDSRYSDYAREEASKLIYSSLKENKLHASQVEFEKDSASGLVYTATINCEAGKLKAKIAVEIQNSIILPPTSLEFNGESLPLSKEALLKVARSANTNFSNEFDPLMMSMSYPELKKQLKNAAYKKSHKLAQQIISLVEEKFGSHYGNAAIDDYQTWLEESSSSYQARCGDCDHYIPKTAQSQNDYCNLIKTAAKNVNKDSSGICTRSTYAGSEESILLDGGNLIKINLD